MFESDDWTFEGIFDDIDEKALQSRPLCQNEEEPSSSVKRRKLDSCLKLSPSSANSAFGEFRSDAAIASTVKDDPPAGSSKSRSESRGHLLLAIFQENAPASETTDFTQATGKTLSGLSREAPRLQSSKAKTDPITNCRYKESSGKNAEVTTEAVQQLSGDVKLVRMFPGPAGLVPDTKSDDVTAASCLTSAIALENKTARRAIEANLAKSQSDERNLFDEEAWRLLLDDLPDNFFKEHGIFTMKSRANASHCESMRVRFVAGMIDYVDHGRDNPLIVLKDSTGSVEGTVHRDVALNYPGVLEPNVVVLLRDVGLLRTVTYVVTNKYHILVSRTNLVAAYSSKGRIANTSRVEDVLSCIRGNSAGFHQDRSTSVSERCRPRRINDPRITSSTSRSSHDRESTALEAGAESGERVLAERNAGSCEIPMESIFEDFNFKSTSMDDSDANDTFFAVDCESADPAERNRPEGSSCRPVPPPCLGKPLRYESQAQCTRGIIGNTREESTTTTHLQERKNQDETRNLSRIARERVAPMSDACRENRDPSSSHDVLRRATKVKSASPTTGRRDAANTSDPSSCFAGDNDGYDSDDEFLSQLDIDSISDKR